MGRKYGSKQLAPTLRQGGAEKPVDRRLHQRGYELWRAGLSPSECRKRLHVSKQTWEFLLKEGSEALPSYENMMIDEVAAIRNSASEIALEMSTGAVKVLRDRMQNAGKANELIAHILNSLGRGEVTEENILMFKQAPSLLKALLPIANATSAAEAFSRIYGASVAQRGLYPTLDHHKAEFRPALDAVQGKDGDRATVLPAEQRDQVLAEVSDWTDEQVDSFLDEGGEPDPGEVTAT